jgi:hypothetical protein
MRARICRTDVGFLGHDAGNRSEPAVRWQSGFDQGRSEPNAFMRVISA